MEDTQRTTVAERVAKGAALLDEVKPDWRDRIDQGRLNMMSNHDCVLGQLWGDDSSFDPFMWAVRELGLVGRPAADHGFDIYDTDDTGDSFAELHGEWTKYLP